MDGDYTAAGGGNYRDIAGHKTWYDESGDSNGDALLLLHGGMSDGRAWGAQLGALDKYRVLIPDRRGHGRTPDSDAPFSYQLMADDTIAFIDAIVGGPAHLIGWSDGANVALLVAQQRPDLVRRQVLIGANFHHEGLIPEAADLGSDPEAAEVALFKGMYESITVDGADHWPEFFAKTSHMWANEPTLTPDDLASVTTPTLVLVGDDEPIHLAHTVALYESLPNAQLAVVPGTSHLLTMEKPALVNQLLVDFLAETAPPGTIMPVRRAQQAH